MKIRLAEMARIADNPAPATQGAGDRPLHEEKKAVAALAATIKAAEPHGDER